MLRIALAILIAPIAFLGAHTCWYAIPKMIVDNGFTDRTNFPISMCVSTMAAGAAACFAWSLPVRLRTERRRRMGLCLTCGYDLRASVNRCPECGVAFDHSPKQRIT
jgi:hypothetical protein